MINFTIYSSIRYLKFSRLIYHTSKQSSASTHACISPAKANRAYSIGLSMARAFNAYCELGGVFNPSSAFLVSERLGHETCLQHWIYTPICSLQNRAKYQTNLNGFIRKIIKNSTILVPQQRKKDGKPCIYKAFRLFLCTEYG